MNANRTSGRVALTAALAGLTLSLGIGLVGCGGAAGAGTEGALGQTCYPNKSCNAGLACANDKCVEAPSGGAGGGGGGGGSSSTSASGFGGAGGSSGTKATSSSSAAGGSGGAPPSNQPPRFLSFGTNVTTITQGQSVTVSAVLTDPDGIDDVIGGSLLDESGATYGAFATTGQEGAYELTVSWDQINQVTSIEFAQGATKPRVLTAQFFDQEGHSVEQSTTITLTCNGNASCTGTCTNTTDSASHCGSCGHACSNGNGCYDNKCGKLSACLPNASTCEVACAAIGKVCKNLCGGAGGEQYDHNACSGNWHPMDCTEALDDASMNCCCF